MTDLLPPVLKLLKNHENHAADTTILEVLTELPPDVQGQAVDILIERNRAGVIADMVRRFRGYPPSIRGHLADRIEVFFHAIRKALESDDDLDARLSAIEFIVAAHRWSWAYLLADAMRSRCPATRSAAANGLFTLTVDCLDNGVRFRDASPEPQALACADRRKLGQSRDRQGVGYPEPQALACAVSQIQSSRTSAHDPLDQTKDGGNPAQNPDNERLTTLAKAVETAIQSWEHHFNPRVLQVAMWLADHLEPAIRAKVKDPQSRIVPMICGYLESMHDSRIAPFIFQALTFPDLRDSAARAIARAEQNVFRRAIVAAGGRCKQEEVAKGCLRVRHCDWLQCDIDAFLEAGRGQAPLAVDLAMTIGSTPEQKAELLRQLIDTGEEEWFRPVLAHISPDRTGLGNELLVLFVQRAPGDLAIIARRELRRRQATPRSTGMMGPTSPTGSADSVEPTGSTGLTGPTGLMEPMGTASILGSTVSIEDFANTFAHYWLSFDELSEKEHQDYLKKLRTNQHLLMVHLRAKLAGAKSFDRGKALRVVRRLRLAHEFNEHVFHLCHDADPLVRSHAMAMLVDLPGPTARRILLTAMNDRDPRVQANVVEALDELKLVDDQEALLAKLESPHNRVRANAIQALLKLHLPEAADALVSMLEDKAAAHRMSALWVAERLKLQSVFKRVAIIGQKDPDPRVRRRAQRVLGQLSDTLAWSDHWNVDDSDSRSNLSAGPIEAVIQPPGPTIKPLGKKL